MLPQVLLTARERGGIHAPPQLITGDDSRFALRGLPGYRTARLPWAILLHAFSVMNALALGYHISRLRRDELTC